MHPLQRSAVRPLIILLFLTAARGFDIILKNGVLTVEKVNDNLMIVNLTKNDGANMVNILYARSRSAAKQSSSMLDDSGDNEVYAEYAQTELNIGAEKETITITRTLADPDGEFYDCFQLTEDTQWFGGPQHRYQQWPIQHMYYDEVPYLPSHHLNMAIAERYWLSSKGIYIYVSETSPLFLDQNNFRDNYLCLVAKNKAPYQLPNKIVHNYTLGIFSDPKTAHLYAVNNHLGKPQSQPNETSIRYPMWSTGPRHNANINEMLVESYANEIIARNFTKSHIEIDDNWETCYGSLQFNSVKFPNISALTKRLKSKGFNVTLWIHPFVNGNCEPAYSTALNKSYLVENLDGHVQMSWWRGSNASVIDITTSDGISWIGDRFTAIGALGIDNIKLDAGEVSWLPQVPKLHFGNSEMQPGIYTALYVVLNYLNTWKKKVTIIEMRVGWRTQLMPAFIRMIDKDTSWTWNNGLPTLITTLLQMNLNGYVFVMPDKIGGNGYPNGVKPSKEIFIRWLQAVVFMPALRYSFAPWDYDNETIEICRNYTKLHETYTPQIVAAMKEAVVNGTPVNPPIWWIDPTDKEAHNINDEYLLGESILAAPVIEEGAESRDIYLPKGTWQDMYQEKKFYRGPIWLSNYPAPLGVLPYFKKI